MATLISTAITSLDGYIEDAASRFDWAAPDTEVHALINDVERSVGTHLFGRRMYETMAVWQTIGDEDRVPPIQADFAETWRAADKVVYSRTLDAVWTPRARLEATLDADAVRHMKEVATQDISIGGRALPCTRSGPGWSTKPTSSSSRSSWAGGSRDSLPMSVSASSCSMPDTSPAAWSICTTAPDRDDRVPCGRQRRGRRRLRLSAPGPCSRVVVGHPPVPRHRRDRPMWVVRSPVGEHRMRSRRGPTSEHSTSLHARCRPPARCLMGLERDPAHPDPDRRAPVASQRGSEASRPSPQRAPARPRHLVVGPADDRSERQADRIADVVSRLIERNAAGDATTPFAATTRIARAVVAGGGDEGGVIDAGLADEIRGSRGTPLDGRTKSTMEKAFGLDLGDVRIHRASVAAPRINAAAFTVGHDVHFAPGRYAPDAVDGRWLLAHELTHVVQQTDRVARRSGPTVIRRGRRGASGVEHRGAPQRDPWIDQLPEPLRPGVRRLVAAITGGELTVSPAQARQLRMILHSLVVAMSGETSGEHQGSMPTNTIAASHVVSLVMGRDVSALFRGCDVMVVAGARGGLPAIGARTGPDVDDAFHEMMFGPGVGPIAMPTQRPRMLQIEAQPEAVTSYLTRYARTRELAKNILEAAAMDLAIADRWMRCTLHGWDEGPLAALVGEYKQGSGGATVAAWTSIATCHPTLANRSGDVAALGRIGDGWTSRVVIRLLQIGWTPTGLHQLVEAAAGPLTIGPGGWAAIAAAHPTLADDVADVCTFAGSGLDWAHTDLAELAAAYAADRASLSAHDWVDIARTSKSLDAPSTIRFARLGWTAPAIKELLSKYLSNSYGLDADHWVRIARCERFRNKPAEVTLCAMAGAFWTAEDVVGLAATFERSTTTWPIFSFVVLAKLLSHHDAATLGAFCGLGLDQPKVKNLVTCFATTPGGPPAAQWVEVVSCSPEFKTQPELATSYLQLDDWSSDARVVLATTVAKAKKEQRPKHEIVLNIARNLAFRDDTAGVIAFAGLSGRGWKSDQVTKLIARFGEGQRELRAVDWARLAVAHHKLNGKPGDVAEFARIGHGWSVDKLEGLVRAYGTNPGNLVAGGWATLARTPDLTDRDDIVIGLAQSKGWSPGKLTAIALAFTADTGGLELDDWLGMARLPRMADQDDAVREFAQLRNGWTAPALLKLTRSFAERSGRRRATEWCEIAIAHPSLADAAEAVAAVARLKWTVADVASWCTNVDARTAAGTATKLLALDHFEAYVAAMMTAQWSASDLGTYVSTCLATGATTTAVTDLLSIAQTPAATQLMRTRWSVIDLGTFSGRVLEQHVSAKVLVSVMNTVGFAQRSFAVISGTWTADTVGRFCGVALHGGLRPDALHDTLNDQQAPAAMQALSTWTVQEVGELTAGARTRGVGAAELRALLSTPDLRAGAARMKVAGWSAGQIGELCGAARTATVAVNDIVTLLAGPTFGATSYEWINGRLTPKQLGTFVGGARSKGLPCAAVATFMGTAAAATTCFSLMPTWTAVQLGETVGFCRTRITRPTDTQMVQLLTLARAHAWTPQAMQLAADGDVCGQPNWTHVITHAPTFALHCTGLVNRQDAADMTFAVVGVAVPYRVKIRINGERKRHVEGGHTFEHFVLTFANCTRDGVWFNGFCTFFPLGTDAVALMVAKRHDVAAQALAIAATGDAGYHEGPCGNDFVGIQGSITTEDDGGPGGPIYETSFMRFHLAVGGVAIRGKVLVAIGRLMGKIT